LWEARSTSTLVHVWNEVGAERTSIRILGPSFQPFSICTRVGSAPTTFLTVGVDDFSWFLINKNNNDVDPEKNSPHAPPNLPYYYEI
jgi:hypothetical protein